MTAAFFGLILGVRADVGNFSDESGRDIQIRANRPILTSHRTDSVSSKVKSGLLDGVARSITGANPLHVVCWGTLVDLPTPTGIGWIVGVN